MQNEPQVVPLPMILTCPVCNGRHIDEGEFATKVHHTHSCQHCGLTWRPAVAPTVGVQFLPGFKNAADAVPSPMKSAAEVADEIAVELYQRIQHGSAEHAAWLEKELKDWARIKLTAHLRRERLDASDDCSRRLARHLEQVAKEFEAPERGGVAIAIALRKFSELFVRPYR